MPGRLYSSWLLDIRFLVAATYTPLFALNRLSPIDSISPARRSKQRSWRRPLGADAPEGKGADGFITLVTLVTLVEGEQHQQRSQPLRRNSVNAPPKQRCHH